MRERGDVFFDVGGRKGMMLTYPYSTALLLHHAPIPIVVGVTAFDAFLRGNGESFACTPASARLAPWLGP